jgi:hypothetical protein
MRTALLLLTLPLLTAPLAARQSPPPPTRTLEEAARLRAELERVRELTAPQIVSAKLFDDMSLREYRK